ncbi:hypothetical protein J2Z23_001259 [Lederbergia galactosidilyticus]|nr:hypothetical protein [Lederbergia galactosidilytica]
MMTKNQINERTAGNADNRVVGSSRPSGCANWMRLLISPLSIH